MNIVWYGQSFFELTTKSIERESVKISIDPFGKDLGRRPPKIEADILLISHQNKGQANVQTVSGAPFLIEEPGEYETKGIFIKGIPAFRDNSEGKERGMVIIYKIEAEGMNICHLSVLGQKELTPEQLEKIGDVDILMLPVGLQYSLEPKEASGIISQIEPKVVIPMYYKIAKLKVHPVKSRKAGIPPKAELFNGVKLGSVDKFLKIMGAEDAQPQKKLKVSLKDLPKEETKIVVLTP